MKSTYNELILKESIKKIGHRLFFEKGFKDVSVEEICFETEVSKETFYTLYQSKEELAKEVLVTFYQKYVCIMREIIESKCGNFQDKLELMTISRINNVKEMSPLLMKEVIDLNDDDIFNSLDLVKEETTDVMTQWFEQAKEEGCFSSDIEVSALVLLINRLSETCIDPEFQSQFSSTESMVKRMSEIFINGIVNNSKCRTLEIA